MKIGLKIRELRKQHSMTQEQLAEYLSVTSQAVSKWEKELAYPEIIHIPKIAKLFGVSTDSLFVMDDNIE